MITIAVANQKGGVGKTTVTVSWPPAAPCGAQTLAIDVIHKVTYFFGIDADIYEATLSHVLIEPDSPSGIKAGRSRWMTRLSKASGKFGFSAGRHRLARFEMQTDYLTIGSVTS